MKDPIEPFKELIEKKTINISKVIGIQKLREKYQTFEARRKLCNKYDLFICDDRITPLCSHLLGKKFIQSKKLPVPIKLDDDFSKRLDMILNSVLYFRGRGNLVYYLIFYRSIKVGTTVMKSKLVKQNIKAVIPALVEKLPNKWDNVQSINIKTNSSPALPIYNNLPK